MTYTVTTTNFCVMTKIGKAKVFYGVYHAPTAGRELAPPPIFVTLGGDIYRLT